MAITAAEYTILKQLRDMNALPVGGSVLELGESNWYGDVSPDLMRQDIQKYAADDRTEELFKAWERAENRATNKAPGTRPRYSGTHFFSQSHIQQSIFTAPTLHLNRTSTSR